MLVAPDYATLRQNPGPSRYDEDDPLARFRSSYRLNAKDIILFGQKFRDLTKQIYKFVPLLSRVNPEDEPTLILKLKEEHPKAFAREGR
jgi:hypothetical protein